MATSRISINTTLSSSRDERRQIQARIRALQHRTSEYLSASYQNMFITLNFLDALYEELSHSSSIANTAVHDIEEAYMMITNEFHEQRNQLLKRIHHVKKNIQQ